MVQSFQNASNTRNFIRGFFDAPSTGSRARSLEKIFLEVLDFHSKVGSKLPLERVSAGSPPPFFFLA